MFHDSNQQRLIIDRGWLIYDLISSKFIVPHQFHVEYPSVLENAIITGYFQLSVVIDKKQHLLRIHEEYAFRDYELVIKAYSYNMLDKNENNIIRADSLPHYKTDYKGKKLKNFPHHLHDKAGRICQFSGKIEDFIGSITLILRNNY